MGEAWWLMRDGDTGSADSLLVSSHTEGFTAVILRAGQPLFVRAVSCEREDLSDELFRFLLFYRDRNTVPPMEGEVVSPTQPIIITDRIERLLVAGTGLDYAQASAIVEETLSAAPRPVGAADLRLSFPTSEIDFQQIAAPAGLAALAWA